MTTEEIVSRAFEVFRTDVGSPPPLTLRGGNAVDSYNQPVPFDPAEDEPSDAYFEGFAFWGLGYLDARSWRHYLPRLLDYAFRHPNDPAMVAEAREEHQDRPWPHHDCAGPGEPCPVRNTTSPPRRQPDDVSFARALSVAALCSERRRAQGRLEGELRVGTDRKKQNALRMLCSTLGIAKPVENHAHVVGVGSFLNTWSIAQKGHLRRGTESSPSRAP